MKATEKLKKIKESVENIFNTKKKAKAEKRRRLIYALTVFFIFLVIILVVSLPIFTYEFLYQNKIYVGVYIDGINFGGQTKEAALDELNQYIDNLKQRGLNFNFGNQRINVDMTIVSPTDPDLAYQILGFETEKMVDLAYAYGRDNNLLTNLADQLTAILRQEEVSLQYSLNEVELKNTLSERFKNSERPAVDAQLVFGQDNNFEIKAESQGFVIDYDQALSDFKNSLNLISLKDIELKTKPSLPLITKIEAENNKELVYSALKNEKINFVYGDKKWELPQSEFKNYLGFAKEDGKVILTFKDDLLRRRLAQIGQEINILPQNAKFTMVGNKVTEFEPSKNGLELDLEKNPIKINQEFFKEQKTTITLLVKESEPAIKTGDINQYGIKELIGVGISDFAGSHTNRIKNIKNAVEHLNGLIIPPGEFSLVDAIGEVNAATGYFPEYVIKGDRTIPEYGGGLCQIGTTMFRVALYSGLPIVERRPHTYIVSYYKPLGMDATIYGPHPDLRFNNDTGHNILLQIKIDGTQLTFEFWGTSDGRKVEITDPQLYNWTAQPADRLIENPELKPGAKILKETGRRGADAFFYRYITLSTGEKKEEIFRSHYVPWPNIYEVGITPKLEEQPVTETSPEPSASSSSAAGESGTLNKNTNTAQ
jgi:vancomycin resistance protein YoaR